MATSSILGGARAPAQPGGTDVDALGPSDSSDSGSDVQTDRNRSVLPDESAEGALPIAHGSTTDAAGTGERAAADAAPPREDADVLPDRVGALPPGPADDNAPDDPRAASADELASEEDEGDAREDDA